MKLYPCDREDQGVVTLMRTQAIVTSVWFSVSNILGKNKLQMKLFS
jgi:hypothetical protein